MKIGDQIGWQWGSGLATGEVIELRPQRTQIESKGKIITRNGTPDSVVDEPMSVPDARHPPSTAPARWSQASSSRVKTHTTLGSWFIVCLSS